TFGLDLAVRQMAETGESTLENLTMDLPEDHESADLAAQSVELVEPGESATALVAYGPVDTSLETELQSRNDEELNETIELEDDSEAADDEEEEDEEESEDLDYYMYRAGSECEDPGRFFITVVLAFSPSFLDIVC